MELGVVFGLCGVLVLLDKLIKTVAAIGRLSDQWRDMDGIKYLETASGKVEAITADGYKRFKSMAALRAFVERR